MLRTVKYVRNPNPRPESPEISCPENNAQIFIGKENYFPSADGFLMPAKKDQPPRDLRYFTNLESNDNVRAFYGTAYHRSKGKRPENQGARKTQPAKS